jgi:hypothetical protein
MKSFRQPWVLGSAALSYLQESSSNFPSPPPGFHPVKAPQLSIWPAAILFGCGLLTIALAVTLCFRSTRLKLRNFLTGLFLLRHIRGALMLGYLICASFAAIDIPWRKEDPLWHRDLPLGFHFVWEYGSMGTSAHPVYGLVALEQFGILMCFGALYKFAETLYDILT